MLAPEYPLVVQAKLIPALAVLHNFIRIHDPSDLPEDDDDQDHDYMNNNNGPDDVTGVHDSAGGFREEMALRMWRDYQEGRHRRP